jgi:hypothetical protein
LAQQQKGKKQRRNRSGMFRTNAPNIVVTEHYQNRKNPGMNLSGRPEQAQKSFATEKRKTPRDKPFWDVPKQTRPSF